MPAQKICEKKFGSVKEIVYLCTKIREESENYKNNNKEHE